MRDALDPSLDGLTQRIIGAAFTVSNTLGHGFLEAIYRNALVEELVAIGLPASKDKPFKVYYREKQIGFYVADLVVDDRVIIELKVVNSLAPAHFAQVLNYLKISGIRVGLLLNFGQPKLAVRRIVL